LKNLRSGDWVIGDQSAMKIARPYQITKKNSTIQTGIARAVVQPVTPQELRERSMSFAVRVVRFCRTLPATWEGRRIAGQLMDSATSTAINYRAAGHGRSHREFTAKLGVVTEEADETLGWLELIARLELARGLELHWLLKESKELTAIFGSGFATAREKDRALGRTRAPGFNRRSPDRRSPDSS
jgi:four helix bundle protein